MAASIADATFRLRRVLLKSLGVLIAHLFLDIVTRFREFDMPGQHRCRRRAKELEGLAGSGRDGLFHGASDGLWQVFKRVEHVRQQPQLQA